ncbi:polyhydroxybutyrate depolymerase [Corynebacterium halotolerans YIM 70093 = DSM 44683]|uniref:Polyhydroxybutyrate depolymerase n=1 Tax=Corynebacterium halotolerans YIM 70093 = DSM 44683 TaxID=1121362 RepID=M1NLN7_9CORY|nr:polyhydroxybutyrate depolymerase [Corynebacterium halotolerans YIM 70093 = DSM 44683]
MPDTTVRLEVPVPGGPTRDVLISLPENYDPTRTYPVWLAYPGRSISPEHMSTDTGLQVASDAIVAYGRGEGGAWAGAPYAVTDMAEDIAYSRAVVDRIAQDHLIDRDRVYAIGHSNGGGFALALACHAPDLVAGVVGVSGIYYNPGTPASGRCAGQPVPVMIIHSRNDGLSLIEGATAHGVPYVGAAAMVGIHAAINGCGGATTRPVAPGVTAHVRQGCEAATELILSESDGHGWPHYSAFEAWDFLSAQNL